MALDTPERTTIGDASVAELAEALRGELLRPGDEGYDAAASRVWNGMYTDRRPALVVRCLGAADVAAAVRFARSAGLEIAVRGGGHSIPGFSTTDGGMVIELEAMKAVIVDPERRRAIVQAGATWSDVDHETQAYGLAVTGGLVSTTGVAGFTLGGGIGWLMRKYGLTADNLIAADVVTADGRQVRASAEEHPDLFWALRGGGGNFGIVTAFEYELHPVGPILFGGPKFYPGERTAEIVRWYDEWVAAGLPDELTTFCNVFVAPPAPFLPPEVHGKPIVAIIAVHSGPVEEGERSAARLAELGEPMVDLMGPMPYTVINSLLDDMYPFGIRSSMRAGYADELPDAAIEVMIDAVGKAQTPFADIHIQHLEGAVAAVPADATAFGDRTHRYSINVMSCWMDAVQDEAGVQWGRETLDALGPYTADGVYSNFMGREGADRARETYGDKYDRLVALKRQWDPDNAFRLNQNVRP